MSPDRQSRVKPPLWLLSVASSLSPFGMSIVIPALGGIQSAFSVSFAEVQLVISAYLLGLGLTQPICGYLCDRLGRRRVMLFGFIIFTGASVLCAMAPSFAWLVVGRFLQAAGVSVGTVASRAMLRDTFDRNRMAEAMSLIAAAMGIAPIIAPIIGGYFDVVIGFASIFWFAAVVGAFVWAAMWIRLRETLRPDFNPPQLRDWMSSYATLLRSPSFIGNTLTFGFVQGAFFSFMAIGAVYFLQEFNVDSGQFGLYWGAMAVNYVFGAALAAKLTQRLGSARILKYSVLAGAFVGACIWLSALIYACSILAIMLPLAPLMMLAGATTPASMAAAVADHPGIAGTASGLSSAIGLVVGGSFSVIAGVIYQGQYAPIAALMFASCIATALSWALARWH